MTHVKWVTDQTNIKNSACENTLYTSRNTKKCLSPVVLDEKSSKDVINSKSSLILFGFKRTKQLYLSFKAFLDDELTVFDDEKLKIIGNRYVSFVPKNVISTENTGLNGSRLVTEIVKYIHEKNPKFVFFSPETLLDQPVTCSRLSENCDEYLDNWAVIWRTWEVLLIFCKTHFNGGCRVFCFKKVTVTVYFNSEF